MSFGLNIREGRTKLPGANNQIKPSSEKNISKMLKKQGKPTTSGDVSLDTELALQSLGVTATSETKEYSLLGEQTNSQKSENPNIQSSSKKRGKNLASKSFTNDQDPFFEAEAAKSPTEMIEKSNKDRKTTYTKSIPVANYLATIVNGN